MDDEYMNNLSLFDIVYSWGVLHHTGDVWHAIENAASRVKPGGIFYIALYSADVQIDPGPDFWLGIKKKYVSIWCNKEKMDGAVVYLAIHDGISTVKNIESN